jgi:ATP-binding cassette, subfamily B, bacterial
LRVNQFPFYRQMDAMDCGPACLQMIAKYFAKSISLENLRQRCALNRQGVSLLGISRAAEELGFRTLPTKATLKQLVEDAPLPCIAHWQQQHFIVVYRATPRKIYVADPAKGRLVYTAEEFQRQWCSVTGTNDAFGVLLLLEPTARLLELADDLDGRQGALRLLRPYGRRYVGLIGQVLLGMLVVTILQLVFPFLTQAVVDHGINDHDLGFIYVVLIAQLALFFSRTAVEFIRNRILFHVGARLSVGVISDFIFKLMHLPLSFFESRMTGDVLQRVQDHYRLQYYLTSATLSVVFSSVTFCAFMAVLALYKMSIFWVFLIGSALYVAYVLLFLGPRKALDGLRFSESAKNQSALFEIVRAMPEIKLNGAEQQRRWVWERIQAQLFRVNLRNLNLEQAQEGGATLINELKNIITTFLAARLVISGEITLGMMLAVQYVIGQLNAPLTQLTWFIQNTQDAKISLDRLGQVHDLDDEDQATSAVAPLPESRELILDGVSFSYGGPRAKLVLQGLDLVIPEGKVTAIVGVSGSGKTTLMKLLLKFFDPLEGDILAGGVNLRRIASRSWRQSCGVVLQDGQLFSDTIARNIAPGDERVDFPRLFQAVKIANVEELTESLVAGYETMIGSAGVGVSEGQKQRILIARAVYKDPDYLFFDEATSSLDANNEQVIMENLQSFFRGRTVVVIAHRLSTVRNADQIVVLDQGRIVERGTHDELTRKQGSYFRLVKNQLELGL